MRRLAAELRRLRAATELSWEHVSEQTNINGTTRYRIETARTRPQTRTRDSKNNVGPVLLFTSHQWRTFVNNGATPAR